MTGNPKHSEWRSTPNARRNRPGVYITMDKDTADKLTQLAKVFGGKGAAIEALIECYEEQHPSKHLKVAPKR